MFQECVGVVHRFTVLPDEFVIFFCALLALDIASALESGGIIGI